MRLSWSKILPSFAAGEKDVIWNVTCRIKRKFAEVNASLVLNFCDLITGKAVPDPGSGRFGHGACPVGSEQQLLPGVFS